jgi:hypothetical protein
MKWKARTKQGAHSSDFLKLPIIAYTLSTTKLEIRAK